MFNRKKMQPTDVFTPRESKVNEYTFVRRDGFYEELSAAFNGTKHIVIHGDSGTGKSWLYKEFIDANNIDYLTANLSNASRFNAINKELDNTFGREVKRQKISVTKSYEGSVQGESNLGVWGIIKMVFSMVFKKREDNQYKIFAKEPFEACLELLHKRSNEKKSLLVFDNFEAIAENQELIKELSDIILLLDDERYGQYNSVILIVGTPNDLLYYFSNTGSNTSSISNRMVELQEVSKMTDDEANSLFDKGFTKLDYQIKEGEKKEIYEHIRWITGNNPQRLQEYCLALSQIVAKKGDNLIELEILQDATKKWLGGSLSNVYSSIEKMMNSNETTIGRRNQVLYCLGQVEKNEIRVNEIEGMIRELFPANTKGKTINPRQIMGELSNAEVPILRKSPKGDAYFFADPKYRVCLRSMLYLDGQQVKKKERGEII
jgi:hypothetical protein